MICDSFLSVNLSAPFLKLLSIDLYIYYFPTCRSVIRGGGRHILSPPPPFLDSTADRSWILFELFRDEQKYHRRSLWKANIFGFLLWHFIFFIIKKKNSATPVFLSTNMSGLFGTSLQLLLLCILVPDQCSRLTWEA